MLVGTALLCFGVFIAGYVAGRQHQATLDDERVGHRRW